MSMVVVQAESSHPSRLQKGAGNAGGFRRYELYEISLDK